MATVKEDISVKRKRQHRDRELPGEIAAIRAALIEGEQSGVSKLSIDEIWEKARAQRKARKNT